MSAIWVLLAVLAGFWVTRNLVLVVPDGSVVKTYVFGKLGESYGPGVHVGWFNRSVCRQVRLSIGMVGVAVSEQAAEFAGAHLPVLYAGDARVGDPVRIARFDGTDVVVTHNGVPRARTFRCEKCGHMNTA